jgi:LmbE family N-acetylglucosaminyl deacetylase
MPAKTAIAIAAHPDDIEFCMAGTLLKLRRAGWKIHYLNIANGNCGSVKYNATAACSVRKAEARAAAKILGARFHPGFANDLEIIYNAGLLRRVAAVVREVKPTIVLTHSPRDYMEDHTNACRLAVTAAFARGTPNFKSIPNRPAVDGEVTVYHAMPHGLRDPLRRRIVPGAYVNTTAVHPIKLEALAAHKSQQDWLEASQGMNSYLRAMEEFSQEVGRMSKRFRFAEGWRRHLHLGFCNAETDPLRDALGRDFIVNKEYERDLNKGWRSFDY